MRVHESDKWNSLLYSVLLILSFVFFSQKQSCLQKESLPCGWGLDSFDDLLLGNLRLDVTEWRPERTNLWACNTQQVLPILTNIQHMEFSGPAMNWSPKGWWTNAWLTLFPLNITLGVLLQIYTQRRHESRMGLAWDTDHWGICPGYRDWLWKYSQAGRPRAQRVWQAQHISGLAGHRGVGHGGKRHLGISWS